MGVAQSMTYRATVQRNTPAGTDGFGGPGAASWGSHLSDLHCWFYAKGAVGAEREVIDGGKSVTLGSHKMIIPKGTDITEADRVTAIKDRAGVSIMANTMRIHSVTHRHTHLELEVEEVSGDAS